MNKLDIITYLALWGTIILQLLTIRNLRKRIENEQKWSEYWVKRTWELTKADGYCSYGEREGE